ncbi:MAG: adenylosuccinate synthetase [Candidatus Riflebacteria bacterium]|nr:adenylosuccinate synthetase [Candidatus Riflebacteria bacterium]
MKAIAVIGKNFGDEGKGMAVDFLALHSEKPLVVRHNGGAQSGHTVRKCRKSYL